MVSGSVQLVGRGITRARNVPSCDHLRGEPHGQVVVTRASPRGGGRRPGRSVDLVGQLMVVGEVEHQPIVQVGLLTW